jgi:hypothetical protein
MSRIFIPRSVAETSMPYIVNQTLKEFGKDNEIYIITRQENSEIMSRIKGVKGVYIVNTTSFNNKSEVIGLPNIFDNDVIILPVTNLVKLQSYNNVVDFIKGTFKNNKIYYCSFDDLKMIRFEEFKFIKKYLLKFYLWISYFFAVIFLILFMVLFALKISLYKKKRGEYNHGP